MLKGSIENCKFIRDSIYVEELLPRSIVSFSPLTKQRNLAKFSED